MNLRDVPRRCFQGVSPALLATCDAEGIPNVTYLSQVHYVDDEHVALSCQFFNKTKKNVQENPFICIDLVDPATLETYRVEARHVRDETSGPLFDRMSARIQAIASHTGMTGIFKLRSADVYAVTEVTKVEHLEPGLDASMSGLEPAPPPLPVPFRSEMSTLQCVCQRVSRATDLGTLLESVLDVLAEALGFAHSMVFLVDESGERLYVIGSHGYGESGVGAEVALGDGLIGTVARERCILRVAGVGAELRYGRAIRAAVHRAGGGRRLGPEVPLVGLVDAQSQLALPLVAADRLVGVIAVESESTTAFEEWHEAFLEIIATQVAAAIDAMVRRGREEVSLAAPETAPSAPPKPSTAPRRKRRFRYFAEDGCVFVDDEYLVRNVPGRILYRLLRSHVDTGRTDFSNRELRLDTSIGLPAIRDNLESRLVLLKKRLEEKSVDLALVSIGRGQFRLEVTCDVELEEAP